MLRWRALELGPQARKTGVEAVRLHMKSAQSERCFSLEADATQWEVEDCMDMKGPNAQFDLIVDKATVDALLCGDEAYMNVAQMMKEC